MLSENYVAQALTASGHRLYFHEFYMKGDDRNLYEVDFILVKGKKIIPVESSPPSPGLTRRSTTSWMSTRIGLTGR